MREIFAQFCKEDETEDGKAGPLLCVEVNMAIVLVALVEKSISRVDLGDDDDLCKDQGIAERGRK